MIKKVNGGFVVVHCHGNKKGERIDATKKPVTLEKAKAIHAAIAISKSSKSKKFNR